MKLKNITTAERRLWDIGEVKIVRPGEIIEVSKPVYDKRSFSIVRQEKSSEEPRKQEIGLYVHHPEVKPIGLSMEPAEIKPVGISVENPIVSNLTEKKKSGESTAPKKRTKSRRNRE